MVISHSYVKLPEGTVQGAPAKEIVSKEFPFTQFHQTLTLKRFIHHRIVSEKLKMHLGNSWKLRIFKEKREYDMYYRIWIGRIWCIKIYAWETQDVAPNGCALRLEQRLIQIRLRHVPGHQDRPRGWKSGHGDVMNGMIVVNTSGS